MAFIWDQGKSDRNKVKHGIDFHQAREVFDDKNAIVNKGGTGHGEDRWIAVGKILKLFIIAVVFTIRDATIRIISARQAQKGEIKDYISHSLSKSQNDKKTNH